MYSPAELWEACCGVPFRGDSGSYRFDSVRLKKLAFYALAVIMGEIGLLLAGWDGQTGRTGWDGGGIWDGGTDVSGRQIRSATIVS